MYTRRYAEVLDGDERWRALPAPTGERYTWVDTSTYIRKPPFLEGIGTGAGTADRHRLARAVLALLGDSVTTDHISPAGVIRRDGPAARVAARTRRTGRGVQLLRRAAREPRSDDARHLRQHAAAQPTRARNRGRRHRPSPRRRTDDDLRRGNAVRRRRACRSSCSPARSTARGARATGPRRARSCSACGRSSSSRSSASTGRTSSGWACCRCEFAPGETAATLGLTGHEVFRFSGVGSLAEDGPLPRTIRVFAGDIGVRDDRPHRHAVRARRVPRRRDPAVHVAPAGAGTPSCRRSPSAVAPPRCVSDVGVSSPRRGGRRARDTPRRRSLRRRPVRRATAPCRRGARRLLRRRRRRSHPRRPAGRTHEIVLDLDGIEFMDSAGVSALGAPARARASLVRSTCTCISEPRRTSIRRCVAVLRRVFVFEDVVDSRQMTTTPTNSRRRSVDNLRSVHRLTAGRRPVRGFDERVRAQRVGEAGRRGPACAAPPRTNARAAGYR